MVTKAPLIRPSFLRWHWGGGKQNLPQAAGVDSLAPWQDKLGLESVMVIGVDHSESMEDTGCFL